MTYHLSALAEEDLQAAWGYLADEVSEERANQAGRRRSEFGWGVRSFPIGSYVIYYLAEGDDALLIARVLHTRRDQAATWDADK